MKLDPAIVLWTGASGRPSGSIAERVEALGWPLYTVGFERAGAERRTEHRVLDALNALRSVEPERDVLVVRADLDAPAHLDEQLRVLSARDDRPERLHLPGDYAKAFDPLAGLDLGSADRGGLVAWCADRVWQPLPQPHWQESSRLDALWLRADAELDGPAMLYDDLYLSCKESKPANADEDSGPAPLHGHLAQRLVGLLAEGIEALPAISSAATTLHIAHSWGGGVWRWIEDFIEGSDSPQLVLVADSDGLGRICGRKLRLCAAGPGRGVIRELALGPQITGTSIAHAHYADALQGLIERFSVGRIIVSSLIGHALDVLKTDRPTLQVLHDFHPVWPLLDRDPKAFLEDAEGDPAAARAAALSAHGETMRLQPPKASAWEALALAWREAVQRGPVRLAAPTRHVADRWQALHPDDRLDIEIVPHGFRPFDGELPSFEPPAASGRDAAPLHFVIPGQLSSGKGRALLEAALPRLNGRVRLTAVGCGQDGYVLFGQSGIDLVPAYRRDELPKLMAALRPHAALLLSTVPETWSYTLSEMRALGLPVLATRVGSFIERVENGTDGWLFEPDVDALVSLIESLIASPERLLALGDHGAAQGSLADMVADYDRLCPTADASTVQPASAGPGGAAMLEQDRLAVTLAHVSQRADRTAQALQGLEDELARRSRWAETMERQFRERSRWAEQLDARCKTLDERVLEQQADFEQARIDAERRFDEAEQQHRAVRTELFRQIHELQHQRDVLAGELDHLSAEREQILASRSWKLTRPLRVANRLFGRGRLRKLANPVNWLPMGRRFLHHVRLRGLKQTLVLLQSPMPDEPPPEPIAPTAVPDAERVAEPVHWTPDEPPKISVIVPVYNQLHYTAACLRSVVHAHNEVAFEVIVVDDASSDDTVEWLDRCTGIRWMSNPENLGFIGTCNRGAGEAKGDYLVFLNNDTEVRDGWLDALLDVFESRPDAGVVGGKLVFADGSLQEAGGLIFDDGSGWNYGRGDEPGKPQYEFVAECDYVSGACLAIERKRFEDLGGFDTHYAPAYYEDTDLCFKVRAAGLKVYVQPAATIVHFEGVTSGTDENAETGTKRYQKINRQKFLARWADALAQQPRNAPDFDRADPIGHLRHHRLPHRALVIDATTPMPDHDSGSVRMFALLKLLVELGYQTRFLPENRSWAGRHSEALQQAGIEVLCAPWVEDLERWLVEYGRDLDLVVVSRHYILTPVLKLLRTHCPKARLVFDTVDLHFLREEREAEIAGTAAARRAAARTRRQELDLIAEADSTLVVSAFERDLLAELTPEANVHIVSNIHSLQDPGRPFEERADLLFVGGFQHPPNLDAAEWLIEDILPRVREQLPEVELHLIGSKMPESLSRRQAPGLRVHGFVADLEPYLAECRVSVAPLRYGAGVKGKVNQAMSHGLPVVATSCAAEGMFTTHGEDILMADDADAFAAEVVRVYRDRALWQRLAEGGRANVERHFSVDAARRALEGVLGVK